MKVACRNCNETTLDVPGALWGPWSCQACLDRQEAERVAGRKKRFAEIRQRYLEGKCLVLVPVASYPLTLTDEDAWQKCEEHLAPVFERRADRIQLWGEM